MSNVKVVFRASDTATNTAVNGSWNGFVWQCGLNCGLFVLFKNIGERAKNKCGT